MLSRPSSSRAVLLIQTISPSRSKAKTISAMASKRDSSSQDSLILLSLTWTLAMVLSNHRERALKVTFYVLWNCVAVVRGETETTCY